MADGTKIEWTDATWQIITGCSVISPGCRKCYAMRLAGTRLRNHPSRAGLTEMTKAGPVWNGEVRYNSEWLEQPLHWSKPRQVFVCAHGDLFHAKVRRAWLVEIFAVMAIAKRHTFQVLTKRADIMAAIIGDPTFVDEVWMAMPTIDNSSDGCARPEWPLPNVWCGVSVEDQRHAEERIPHLLVTPAAIRWISAEPLLGPINLRSLQYESGDLLPEPMRVNEERCSLDALRGVTIWPGCHYISPSIKTDARIIGGELYQSSGEGRKLDWVVTGGESGLDPHPMHPAWEEAIRLQCGAAGVAYFRKQWGAWRPAPADFVPTGKRNERGKFAGVLDTNTGKTLWMEHVGKKAAGHLLDGVAHQAWPTT